MCSHSIPKCIFTIHFHCENGIDCEHAKRSPIMSMIWKKQCVQKANNLCFSIYLRIRSTLGNLFLQRSLFSGSTVTFFGFFKISSGCQQCPRRENAADKPPYTERKVILKCDCIEIFFKSNHFSTDIEVLQATFCSTSMILLSRYIILHYSIRYTMHDTIQCNTIQRNTTFQMRLFLQLLIMGEF